MRLMFNALLSRVRSVTLLFLCTAMVSHCTPAPSAVKGTLSLPVEPSVYRRSTECNAIAVSSGYEESILYKLQGSDVVPLNTGLKFNIDPRVTADGKQLLFRGSNNNYTFGAYIYDLETHNTTQLTLNRPGILSLVWYIDGDKVLYSWGDTINSYLHLYDIRTHADQVILGGFWSILVYSAVSGNSLALIGTKSDGRSNWSISMLNVETKEISPLTSDDTNNFEASLSPDGRHIIFTSTRDGNAEIYQMGIGGNGITNLTEHTAEDGYPVWLSNHAIGFWSNREGTTGIYFLNLETMTTSLWAHEAGQIYPLLGECDK